MYMQYELSWILQNNLWGREMVFWIIKRRGVHFCLYFQSLFNKTSKQCKVSCNKDALPLMIHHWSIENAIFIPIGFLFFVETYWLFSQNALFNHIYDLIVNMNYIYLDIDYFFYIMYGLVLMNGSTWRSKQKFIYNFWLVYYILNNKMLLEWFSEQASPGYGFYFPSMNCKS